MASIKFDNISFAYGEKQILKNFSLEVEDSQIMCLVGPSGCGKTTLIRCLLGFNKPTTGEIWVGDRCMFSQPRRINVPPERRGIGVVFQDYAVWPQMTVLENVSYPMKKRKMSKSEIKTRAENALKQVRMSEYANYLPSQLSGGQQQRVAIARALVSSDDVIVMDEPITNLDAKLRAEMLVEIRQIQKNIGTTIFYITHDQEASLQLCDKMAIMNNNGELCQLGADEDIILHPANRFVFEFIGVSNFLQHHLDDVLAHGSIVPAANQVELSPLCQDNLLIQYCREKNIAFEAWGPLAAGELIGDRTTGDIGAKYGKTGSQVILRWMLQKNIIVFPKTVHKSRMIENADIFDFELSDEDMAIIDNMNRHRRTGPDPDNFDF